MGQRLEPGGEVRGLADHPALLRGTCADQIADDNQSAGNAEPNVQRLGCDGSADRVDDGEPCADRSLGIVLVSLG